MKRSVDLAVCSFLLTLFSVAPVSPAAAQLEIEWVPVTDPGNPPDDEVMSSDFTTGYGAVAHEYSITKYPITNEQYAEFLNAVASESDPYLLYFICMDTSQCGGAASPSQGTGSGIVRTGSPGSYSYAAEPGRERHPVNFINLYDSMRFANWVNNGRGDADTETGAYTLLGGTPVPANAFSVERSPGAKVSLPDDDEWYKAAYWDPVAQVYYDYPNGTDEPLTCTTPTTDPNTGNCELVTAEENPDNPGLSGVAAWYWSHPTDVDAYPNSISPHGVVEMGTNVFQWTEDLTYAVVNQYHAGSRLSPLYEALTTINDPGSPWETGFGPCGILRGTDFGDGGQFAHANGRTCDYTPDKFETYGMRLVKHDNCSLAANPLQEDNGGIGSSVPDGIGDLCQCGDVTGNGIVNGQDAAAITRFALGVEPNPTFVDPRLCDVTGNGLCNGQDANAIRRAALGAESPLFDPQGCPGWDDTRSCPYCAP